MDGVLVSIHKSHIEFIIRQNADQVQQMINKFNALSQKMIHNKLNVGLSKKEQEKDDRVHTIK